MFFMLMNTCVCNVKDIYGLLGLRFFEKISYSSIADDAMTMSNLLAVIYLS